MDTTLIVFEKKAQTAETCKIISQVLGPCVCVEPQNFDRQLDGHSAVAIIFTLDGEKITEHTEKFLEECASQLQNKKVALVCLSGSRSVAARALKSVGKKLSGNVSFSVRISIGTKPKAGIKTVYSSVPEKTVDKLIAMKRALSDKADMPRDMLTERVGQILLSHNTCALCTGSGGCVRATPIEYVYQNGALYFLSEGGEKFAHLYADSRVSAAVFSSYSGFDKLEGVQIEGNAIMVETFSDEYIGIIESKGFSAENLRKLPVTLNMFKVIPERIEILESSFTKTGYTARQVLKKEF